MPLIVTHGTFETPEFQRQNRDFAAAVKAAGKPVEFSSKRRLTITSRSSRPSATPTGPMVARRSRSRSFRHDDSIRAKNTPLHPTGLTGSNDDRCNRRLRNEMGRPRDQAAGRPGAGDRTRPLYRRSRRRLLDALCPQPRRFRPHRRHHRAGRRAHHLRRRSQGRPADPPDAAQVQLSAGRTTDPGNGFRALRRRADSRRDRAIKCNGGRHRRSGARSKSTNCRRWSTAAMRSSPARRWSMPNTIEYRGRRSLQYR